MPKPNVRSQFYADWVSPQEAAAYLNVSKPSIRKMVKQGRLDARRIGYRTVRITVVSIEKMLECAKAGKTVGFPFGATRSQISPKF